MARPGAVLLTGDTWLTTLATCLVAEVGLGPLSKKLIEHTHILIVRPYLQAANHYLGMSRLNEVIASLIDVRHESRVMYPPVRAGRPRIGACFSYSPNALDTILRGGTGDNSCH